MDVLTQRIEPVDFIAPYHFVSQYHSAVACTRRQKFFVIVKGKQVLLKKRSQRHAQEIFCYAYLVSYKTINERIECDLQPVAFNLYGIQPIGGQGSLY